MSKRKTRNGETIINLTESVLKAFEGIQRIEKEIDPVGGRSVSNIVLQLGRPRKGNIFVRTVKGQIVFRGCPSTVALIEVWGDPSSGRWYLEERGFVKDGFGAPRGVIFDGTSFTHLFTLSAKDRKDLDFSPI